MGQALRLTPKTRYPHHVPYAYAPKEERRYFAQLQGYQVMPVEELFTVQRVDLQTPAQVIISHQNPRAVCSNCGEEIINEREVVVRGVVLCKTCAYGGYYQAR